MSPRMSDFCCSLSVFRSQWMCMCTCIYVYVCLCVCRYPTTYSILLFQDRVSLYSFSKTGPHVVQAGFQSAMWPRMTLNTDLPASVSQVPGSLEHLVSSFYSYFKWMRASIHFSSSLWSQDQERTTHYHKATHCSFMLPQVHIRRWPNQFPSGC